MEEFHPALSSFCKQFSMKLDEAFRQLSKSWGIPINTIKDKYIRGMQINLLKKLLIIHTMCWLKLNLEILKRSGVDSCIFIVGQWLQLKNLGMMMMKTARLHMQLIKDIHY